MLEGFAAVAFAMRVSTPPVAAGWLSGRCLGDGLLEPRCQFGVDLGYTAKGRIIWAVFAPTAGYHKGSLGGLYGGATAEATVGAGIGANVLFGGTSGSIHLQPVSVSGQIGLNIAATGTYGALPLTLANGSATGFGLHPCNRGQQRAPVTVIAHFGGFGGRSARGCSEHFGHGLTAAEVDYLIAQEWACTAHDVLWRRTKLGLHFSSDQAGRLEQYISERTALA